MNISKSEFIRGIKCPKSLWLHKKDNVVKDPVDEELKARFAQGAEVGKHAQKLFPHGKEISFRRGDFSAMIRQTRKWIEEGQKVIFEAALAARSGFAMADILLGTGTGWNIYEVKSTTKVKDYHKYDLAFQYYVFLNAGLSMEKAFLIHLNREYVREGALDPGRLFIMEEITDEVLGLQEYIKIHLEKFLKMLAGEIPQMDIGPQCSKFFKCDFHSCCWKDVPRGSVFHLHGLSEKKKFELFKNSIVKISDIQTPVTSGVVSDFRPNLVQSLQITAEKTGCPQVNWDKIEKFVSEIEYPIYFLDFETFQEPIPRFDGQKPYMQMPFQYSLHVMHGPDELEHKEFLADEKEDPRGQVIEQLLKDIGSKGSILAFNKAFEKGIVRQLAEFDPAHKKELLAINERLKDLLTPFKDGGYYMREFNGSFSLKSVVPALFPDDHELNYQNLSIKNGGMVSQVYAKLHLEKDEVERQRIRNDLKSYCSLDTLTMVRIFHFLCQQG